MEGQVKILDASQKQKVSYCIPLELRDEQIRMAIKRNLPRLQPSEKIITEPIALVCYGGSLTETWEEIKKFKYVMTCSGAHKFLVERGIIPTFHVDLDPRVHKVQLIGQPQKETEYLIASTCHPNMFEHLKDYDVKLWHIFDNKEEGFRILPHGEWLISGGSSVGLRTLTLARFLGFTDFHVFGMDGCEHSETGKHAAFHPSQAKEHSLVEYPHGSGTFYKTTPSFLEVARQTFHELDQLADVKASFYGSGLVQSMAKDYVPKKIGANNIAILKEDIISPRMRELNAQLHRENPAYGIGGGKYAQTVIELSKKLGTNNILDYGAGKMGLAKALNFPIYSYDPCIPEISESPKPADIVINTDMLEHVEADKLKNVLKDLQRVTLKVGYFVIHLGKAKKTYSDGQNCHILIKPPEWWIKELSKYFTIGKSFIKGKELHIVVGKLEKQNPQQVIEGLITTIEFEGKQANFLTPNDTTKWRANTILTKEPITIEWLKTIKPHEVLYDIGANIGGYSVLAGLLGTEVYSFEPEAENFAVLAKNLAINELPIRAFCLAISDKSQFNTLYLSQVGAGGSCHSFGDSVNPRLEERKEQLQQGCYGISIDELVKQGLPQPDHIKIDVDGFEHKVIKGADKTLAKVKSLIIEINPLVEEHSKIITDLEKRGFTWDVEQVEQAKRKEGYFKGVAEYVFYRKETTEIFENLIEHLISAVESSTLIENPFPHLVIENAFPQDIYENILQNLLYDDYITLEKARGTKGYPERFVANYTNEFWTKVNNSLMEGRLKNALCKRFNKIDEKLKEEILLIRDKNGYKIPPHTDIISKVITSLFYLPSKTLKGAGTNLYVPKKEGFICEKGIHYDFKDFLKSKEVKFKPNTLLSFVRSNKSFHGVSPSNNIRDILLYEIRSKYAV